MKLSRRELFRTASIVSTSAIAEAAWAKTVAPVAGDLQSAHPALPPAFEKLQPLGDRVKPIRVDELQGRIARAQALRNNAKPRFDGLYVTPGTTLAYYVGTPWHWRVAR